MGHAIPYVHVGLTLEVFVDCQGCSRFKLGHFLGAGETLHRSLAAAPLGGTNIHSRAICGDLFQHLGLTSGAQRGARNQNAVLVSDPERDSVEFYDFFHGSTTPPKLPGTTASLAFAD